MNPKRRHLLKAVSAILASAPTRLLYGQSSPNLEFSRENFRYIYRNAEYRAEFKAFLENVFHLYPEDELHSLIASSAQSQGADENVYADVQSQLDEIKPFFGDLTYSLPALGKQKDVLADQSAALADTSRRYDGYLEVGSNGRYLDALEEEFEIDGERYIVSERAPGMSLVDILDRGQIRGAGTFIGLDDYETRFAARIPKASIEFANVFIGFHHCPLDLRESFIGSLSDCIKPGGLLVVRDHNVRDEKTWRMVALAHDVFNMGTLESWSYNARELRHFYSLDHLDAMLAGFGFETDGTRLYQDGDPTLNALTAYRKR